MSVRTANVSSASDARPRARPDRGIAWRMEVLLLLVWGCAYTGDKYPNLAGLALLLATALVVLPVVVAWLSLLSDGASTRQDDTSEPNGTNP